MTDSEDGAIDLIMEELPITSLLIDFLQSDTYEKFIVALRLVGNIMSSTVSLYAENFFKNSFLDALSIGWSNFGSNPEVDKEGAWVTSNLISSNSVIMTKACLRHPFISAKIKYLIDLGGVKTGEHQATVADPKK